jgi:hypothetical protein
MRRLRCALGGHDYRYAGFLLGSHLERCLRCGKVRTRPMVGSPAGGERRQKDQPPRGMPDRRSK